MPSSLHCEHDTGFIHCRRKMLTGTYTTPSAQVSVRHDNVAGVSLPRFRLVKGQLEGRADLGLAGGGREIHRAQQSWSALLTLLVRLAGLQTQFTALDEAIRLTSRRVNALENVRRCLKAAPDTAAACPYMHRSTHTYAQVLIPRFSGTIKYVQSELDEMEREDIYRIKKVLEVKKKKLAAEAQARAKFLRQAQGGMAPASPPGASGAGGEAVPDASAGSDAQAAYAGILHDDEDSDDDANLFG